MNTVYFTHMHVICIINLLCIIYYHSSLYSTCMCIVMFLAEVSTTQSRKCPEKGVHVIYGVCVHSLGNCVPPRAYRLLKEKRACNCYYSLCTIGPWCRWLICSIKWKPLGYFPWYTLYLHSCSILCVQKKVGFEVCL